MGTGLQLSLLIVWGSLALRSSISTDCLFLALQKLLKFSLYSAPPPSCAGPVCKFCEIAKEESNHCHAGGAFVMQISLRDWDSHRFSKESD